MTLGHRKKYASPYNTRVAVNRYPVRLSQIVNKNKHELGAASPRFGPHGLPLVEQIRIILLQIGMRECIWSFLKPYTIMIEKSRYPIFGPIWGLFLDQWGNNWSQRQVPSEGKKFKLAEYGHIVCRLNANSLLISKNIHPEIHWIEVITRKMHWK